MIGKEPLLGRSQEISCFFLVHQWLLPILLPFSIGAGIVKQQASTVDRSGLGRFVVQIQRPTVRFRIEQRHFRGVVGRHVSSTTVGIINREFFHIVAGTRMFDGCLGTGESGFEFHVDILRGIEENDVQFRGKQTEKDDRGGQAETNSQSDHLDLKETERIHLSSEMISESNDLHETSCRCFAH